MKIDKAKRVVFVSASASMGGVEWSTLYLAQNLNRDEWHPIILCPEEGDLMQACHDHQIETVVVPHPKFRSTSFQIGRRRIPNLVACGWNLIVIKRITKSICTVLNQIKPEVVVTKGLFPHIYGGAAAKSLKIPCIWHMQDFISERYFGAYRKVIGVLATRLPTTIIADGTPIKDQLPKGARKKTIVIFNGVDTNEFRPGLDGTKIREELHIPLDATVIGNAARLTRWKGQHHLLDAFALLADKCPKAHLLFVGSAMFATDQYEMSLRNRVSALQLENRVTFAGYRRDLAQVLNAMDIFAYTATEKDTSPLSLISAMSCGLPIVAFDIPGVREILRDLPDRDLVEVASSEKLSFALSMLSIDRIRRAKMSTVTREFAINTFDIQSHLSNLVENMSSALGTK